MISTAPSATDALRCQCQCASAPIVIAKGYRLFLHAKGGGQPPVVLVANSATSAPRKPYPWPVSEFFLAELFTHRLVSSP